MSRRTPASAVPPCGVRDRALRAQESAITLHGEKYDQKA